MGIFTTITDPDAINDIVQKINTAVSLKHDGDVLKEDIKEIAKQVKDEYGIKGKDFNAVVNATYKADLAEKERDLAGIKADLIVINENSQ